MFVKVSIDIRKLRDYCLNPHHPVGKHKARVFLSQLGLRRNDAQTLKEKITEKMENAEIVHTFSDEYGKRFLADLELHIEDNQAVVRTIWILKTNRDMPELVTCYIIN